MKTLFSLLLALLLLAPAHSHAATPPTTTAAALAMALAPDGTLRPGAAGSFDTKGYEMFTAPDGRPVFRPASAKGTLGAGDEKWQDGFGVSGTNGIVRAMAVAPNGDVYVGGDFTQAGGVPANHVAK